ncbi:MAG: hypothetical protein V9E94_10985 [Microthrixaceae bacterium]
MIVVLLTISMVVAAALLAFRSIARVDSATAVLAHHHTAVRGASVDELRTETEALAATVSARTHR